MHEELGLLAIFFGIVYLVSSVRRGILFPKYTYIFAVTLLLVALFLFLPSFTKFIQKLLDFSLPSNLLFSILLVIIFITLMQLAKDVLLLVNKMERIIEKIALLELMLKKDKGSKNSPKHRETPEAK